MKQDSQMAESLFQAEIQRVQNPVYCGVLIHFLASGYSERHPQRSPIPIPYIFVAVPCLFTPEVMDIIHHTNAGLRAAVNKLLSSDHSGSDILLSLNRKTTKMRSLTSDAIAILLAVNLASLDVESAALFAINHKSLIARYDLPPDTKDACKLGTWMATLSPFEVSSILKVTF
jgi:hypothetical protein